MGLDCYYIKSREEIDNGIELVPDSRYFRGSIYTPLVEYISDRYTLSKEWIDNDELICIALELSRFIITRRGEFKRYERDKTLRNDLRDWAGDMCSYALQGYGLHGNF